MARSEATVSTSPQPEPHPNLLHCDAGTLVTDPEKIAIRYLKLKFWTDLLATVPLDYFSPTLRFTGLLRLIRMTRLLEVRSILTTKPCSPLRRRDEWDDLQVVSRAFNLSKVEGSRPKAKRTGHLSKTGFDTLTFGGRVGELAERFNSRRIHTCRLTMADAIATRLHTTCPQLFSQLEKNFEVNYIAICLTKFMTLLLLCSHWTGCGFFYIASQLEFNDHTWVGNVALPEGLLKNEPWTTQYVYSVYWAVTTLTTVGYGDISPESIGERVRSSLSIETRLFALHHNPLWQIWEWTQAHCSFQEFPCRAAGFGSLALR
jgi:hypothetical protein